MAIIFTQSAYRHFAEDNLDEESRDAASHENKQKQYS